MITHFIRQQAWSKLDEGSDFRACARCGSMSIPLSLVSDNIIESLLTRSLSETKTPMAFTLSSLLCSILTTSTFSTGRQNSSIATACSFVTLGCDVWFPPTLTRAYLRSWKTSHHHLRHWTTCLVRWLFFALPQHWKQFVEILVCFSGELCHPLFQPGASLNGIGVCILS